MILPFYYSFFDPSKFEALKSLSSFATGSLRIFSYDNGKLMLRFHDIKSLLYSDRGDVYCFNIQFVGQDGGIIINSDNSSILIKVYNISQDIFAFNIDGKPLSFFATWDDNRQFKNYSCPELLDYFFKLEVLGCDSDQKSKVAESYRSIVESRRQYEENELTKLTSEAVKQKKRVIKCLAITMLSLAIIMGIISLCIDEYRANNLYSESSIAERYQLWSYILLFSSFVILIVWLWFRFEYGKTILSKFESNKRETERIRLFGHSGRLDSPDAIYEDYY